MRGRVIVVCKAGGTALVAMWVLSLAVGWIRPWTYSSYTCGYCRASMRHETRLGIPLPTRTTYSEFGSYYVDQVDPHHKHEWVLVSAYTSSGEVADGCFLGHRPLPWKLDERAEIAVCKALGTREARKAFVASIFVPVPKESQAAYERWSKMDPVVEKLNAAYKENPKRTDWVRLLHKCGVNL